MSTATAARREAAEINESAPSPPAATSSATPARPPRRAPFVMLSLIVVAGTIGTTVYLRSRGKESTDDAQVEGHIVNVAPRIAGQVSAVRVVDNQAVHAGDVLVELDRQDLEARLAVSHADLASAEAAAVQARANLALAQQTVDANLRQARGGITQANSVLASTRAGIAQAHADVSAAESRVHLADLELQRVSNLVAQHAVSRAELDSRQAQSEQAHASLAQAEARLLSATTGIANSAGAIESARGRELQAETGPQQVEVARSAVLLAEARVQQSQAQLRLAELNLSYSQVRAPSDGIVSRRTVEVGQTASPERPLMALIPLHDVWVVANFREDQLAHMREHQHAHVTIDAFEGRSFDAHIESIAGASGARFALIPPDNASGNFVKVVQRVPVLLRLDRDPGVVLRPGMSAEVTAFVDR